MRRSRLTGQPKAKDTELGWYFAGKPMDKRYSGNGQIRLVRYGPERETCVHSRCPSPSPIPETPPCSCNIHCELHCELRSRVTRSPSPSDSEASGYDPAKTCCGGCHAIRRDPEPSLRAERARCSCNGRGELHSNEPHSSTTSSSELSDSELATKCCGSCHQTRHQRRNPDTCPTTPASSGLSDHESVRRRRSGHRSSKRGPDLPPRVEPCQCEAYAHPNMPATPSPRFPSPRASYTTAPRPTSMGTPHHCRKASYCETHPETCRASMVFHSPRPRSMPVPLRSSRLSEGRPGEKSHRSPRVKSAQPECTCKHSPALSKEVPPTKPVSFSKPASSKSDHQHCSCHMDGYYADDTGYWTPYDDDTASEASIQAVAPNGFGLRVDESHCDYYHRCCPRFECGVGWVCGRK